MTAKIVYDGPTIEVTGPLGSSLATSADIAAVVNAVSGQIVAPGQSVVTGPAGAPLATVASVEALQAVTETLATTADIEAASAAIVEAVNDHSATLTVTGPAAAALATTADIEAASTAITAAVNDRSTPVKVVGGANSDPLATTADIVDLIAAVNDRSVPVKVTASDGGALATTADITTLTAAVNDRSVPVKVVGGAGGAALATSSDITTLVNAVNDHSAVLKVSGGAGAVPLATTADITALTAAVNDRSVPVKVVGGTGSAALATTADITALQNALPVAEVNLDTEVLATTKASTTRAVLVAPQAGGEYTMVGALGRGLRVALEGPFSAFGELRVVEPNPRFQVDATYGLTSDFATNINTSGTPGTVTESNSVFTLTTSTTNGSFVELTSRRYVRYRPGEGVFIEVTAAFPVGVAGNRRGCGAFNALERLSFHRDENGVFGILRRIAGSVAIYRLTVTGRATGAETMTITLDGTAFTVTSGGALASTALTAQRIADVGVFTGWDATSNGSVVTFVKRAAGTTPGAFSFSSATATGSIAQIRAGAANNDTAGFVAQANWSEDTLSGLGGTSNPSGVTLADAGTPSNTVMLTTNNLVTRIVFPYLGYGTIKFEIMSPAGDWITVHKIYYPGSALIPTMRNPTLRGGWYVESVGSTTPATITGTCAAGFVDGKVVPMRHSVGTPELDVTVSTTEYALLCIRVGRTFPFGVASQERLNLREVVLESYSAAHATSNRALYVRFLLNPTFTAGNAMNWQTLDTNSCAEYAVPAASTVASGGQVLYAGSGGTEIDHHFDPEENRLQAGDVVAICLSSLGGPNLAAKHCLVVRDT